MPGKLRRHDYDLVEEAYDSKSPVQNEDAFEHGVAFKVKVRSVSVVKLAFAFYILSGCVAHLICVA